MTHPSMSHGADEGKVYYSCQCRGLREGGGRWREGHAKVVPTVHGESAWCGALHNLRGDAGAQVAIGQCIDQGLMSPCSDCLFFGKLSCDQREREP